MTPTEWAHYLATFHAGRPGITEDVLAHATDPDGRTPYDWLVAAVPDGGTVLDLACGSGPLHALLRPTAYVGLDLSAAELGRARSQGLPVARADTGQLPVATGSVDVVVMSMALMLVPLVATLAEVARVLRPDGVFVATVPCNQPMPGADFRRYARLCLALRQPGLTYPNDDLLDRGAFTAASLTLTGDEQRGFRCALPTAERAEQLLASLYLPGVAPDRLAAGSLVVRRWAGTSITTPIRRFVAGKPTGSVR